MPAYSVDGSKGIVKVRKSEFNITVNVKPGQCLLPEMLFWRFTQACHISMGNQQPGMKDENNFPLTAFFESIIFEPLIPGRLQSISQPDL